jgi:hypothetical protein
MKGRKVIALLVTTLILINSVVLSIFAQPDPDTAIVVFGDVDKDGNFDSDDYAIFRQYLLGMIGIDRVPTTADVDGNGQYNSDDYAYMRQHLLGMIQVFPAEKSTPSPTATDIPTPTFTPTPTSTPISYIPTSGSSSGGTSTVTAPISTPVPTSQVNELYIESVKESFDIAKITIYIKNIANFSGYQANLIYDPHVLKPVYRDGSEYDIQSPVEAGSLLTNQYSPIDFAKHDLQSGVLNFARAYMSINAYKASGVSEHSGSIAIIYFRMLKQEYTHITLANCNTMPEAISGTILTDWDGNQIFNYTASVSYTIMAYMPTHTPVPYPTPTPTPTNTIAPSVPPIIIPPSYPPPAALKSLSMNGERVSNSTGDFYKVTLNVQNIANFAGYQVSLKYDPNVIMPVYSTGSQFKSASNVESGTLLTNDDFSPLKVANHDLANGILNFGIAYIDINSYKNSGAPETSGSIGVIYFKVLKHTPTSIKLTDSDTLPSGLNGTSLYDWNSTQILDYAVFPLLVIDSIISTITPAPTSTPITTTTPAPASTPVPYTPTASSTVIPTYTPVPANQGSIILDFDKSQVEAGETVTVKLKAKNINNIGAYAAAIKYDPKILKFDGRAGYYPAVYPPRDGFEIVLDDNVNGIVVFRKKIINPASSNTNTIENEIVLEKPSFTANSSGDVNIGFDNTNSLIFPSNQGIALFDWTGSFISHYNIIISSL